jgi:hypothetical protein
MRVRVHNLTNHHHRPALRGLLRMGEPLAEPSRITEIAEEAARMFMCEQAAAFLDCSINLCATTMELSALIKLLEDHAAILKEYG